ncbi:MAG: glycoside hydrolase family 16 protein [Bacteroidota bacterium]
MNFLSKSSILIFFLSATVFMACEPSDQVLENNPCDFSESLEGYDLVWEDEFDGSIDESSWSFNIGDGCDRGICGWGNNELQYYTDRAANARTDDGKLIIRALAENTPFQGYDYTSARMVTKNKVDIRYGRIDIHAKLPKGQGIWPALWMLSTEEKFGIWPRSGEIDIMELIGNRPSEIFGTVHWGLDFWRFKSSYYELEGEDFSEDFHTFSLLWREDCMRFMVDGKIYGNAITPSVTLPSNYPFNEDFHLIFNIAVGGNLPGNPDANTVFPQEMQVEYVKVYSEK